MTATKEKWVCAGERYLTFADRTQGLGTVWYRVEGGSTVGDEKLFGGKKRTSMKMASVGSVYIISCEETPKGTTYGRESFVGPWEDKKQCLLWEALSDAAKTAARAAKEERSAKSRDFYSELLEPLHRAYVSSDPIGRQVILVKVIRAIQRGP